MIYISAMCATHNIAFVAFDAFQMLDITGPASVYGSANDVLAEDAYAVSIVSSAGGPVTASCGVAISSLGIADSDPAQFDAVFVSGGHDDALRRVIADDALRDWTRLVAKTASRFGSVCSGSVVLAAWDMIGSHRFATHWEAVAEIGRRWPGLALDPDAIYVNDGRLWTSAGVTTGIDMTLAIVEADHGADVSRRVAQRLVLSARRPGWQSQFSPALAAPAGRYGDVIHWIGSHIDQPLPVESLAEHAGESLRSFHRNFTAVTGSTPAHYIMRLRIDHARKLIVDGVALKQVAAQSGFASVAQLSAAFAKIVGMTASEWRLVHG
jgi:transcriptional regulator GlxA family with amidase domain